MTFCFARPRWYKVILIVVLLVVVGAAITAISRSPLPPQVIVLAPGSGMPTYKVPLPDHWIPVSWGWLWRLKQTVLGSAKRIDLNLKFIELKNATNPLEGREALAETNGVRVWILNDAEMTNLSRHLEQLPGNLVLSSPRISTADGVQSGMSMGSGRSIQGVQSSESYSLIFSPGVRQNATDLTMAITVTDTTVSPSGTSNTAQTNLAVTARIQIPKGSGLFLLDANPSNTNGRHLGLMISATRPQKK
ncbi:MAG: hypothetical protein JWR19_2087 [Pedosphaera sp.]|nr:hypothetical protein [Pedosphaera sp.]